MELKQGKNACINPACDSSDALQIYEDNTGYCFSCHTFFSQEEVLQGELEVLTEKASKRSKNKADLTIPSPANVSQRGLHKATLAHYGVGVEFSQSSGEVEKLVFPVYHQGNLTGKKIKTLNTKHIISEGSCKNPDFFGAHKVGSGGKLLIITEGEEDCMATYQMLKQQGKDYSVVSLPSGANVSSVKKRIEWLESFETIILNLDNDKVGQKACEDIADIITPGKVKVMKLPVKDSNEFLMKGHSSKEFLKCVYNAKIYSPDGVVALAESWDLLWSDASQQSIPYPWNGLNQMLYGMRNREIITLTGGTGIGKSAITRELEHWLLKQTQDNIGILALEESVSRTAWGIVSVEANLPLSIREERSNVSHEDIREWFDNTLGTNRIFTLDHFGSTSEENLLSRIRYMIKGLNCKWVVLDHLSIVVSAMGEDGDERRTIDSIMTKLRQLCEETNAGLILVSHLRRVDGNKGHEQGIEVSLSHLRGSQAIAQLSDAVIAFERNQQAEDIKEANLTKLRVIKNRYAGITGVATHLAYAKETGRLSEIIDVQDYLSDNDINI